MLVTGLHPGSFYIDIGPMEGLFYLLIKCCIVGGGGSFFIVWPFCLLAIFQMEKLESKDKRFTRFRAWLVCGSVFGAIAMFGYAWLLGLGLQFIVSIALTGVILGTLCASISWTVLHSEDTDSAGAGYSE